MFLFAFYCIVAIVLLVVAIYVKSGYIIFNKGERIWQK